MKGLTDIPGILVGHASDYDALTGCTVVICEGGAVGGVDIRGSSSGTEEFDLMSPLNTTDRLNAIVFAGGSAFGLEAGSGVRRFLEHKGVGYTTSAGPVPLVPCAILYDLDVGKKHVRPTREMGEAAAAAASSKPVEEGAVGAGTGARLGMFSGIQCAMKAGLGSATVELPGGILVSSMAVVNAFGDVTDPHSGNILAGARRSPDSTEFLGTAAEMKKTGEIGVRRQNTTLVVVATNARLSKAGATKLAQLASIGVARTISPVWTTLDGDLVIALSAGSRQAELDTLGVAAAECVSRSIVRAVQLAPSMGGLPGLKG